METTQIKPSRGKRTLRSILFVMAVFVTLAALLIAEENWRGAHAWESYKKEMEARGEHFDAARLIPPKVPDDQNFGMTPYFAPYFYMPPEILRIPVADDAVDGQASTTQKVETIIIDGHKLVSINGTISRGTNLGSFAPYASKLPPQPLTWPGGIAADLIAYAGVCTNTNDAPLPAQIESPVQAASIILAHMQPCEPELAELRKASLRPYSRFNVPYEEIPNPQVFSALVEHFASIKGLYQVLNKHAESEMVLGQTDAAMKDLAVLFRIDDGLKDEPLLISQLVRIADVSIILQSIGEGLAERRWSDAQLQTLQTRLQKVDLVASTQNALYGERDIMGNLGFDRGYAFPIPLLSGWRRFEQLNLNRMFEQTVLPRMDPLAEKVDPEANHLADVAVEKLEMESGIRSFFQHRMMVWLELPAISRAAPKVAYAQAKVDMAVVSCALERYHLAQGRYPENLSDLVPRFAASLPHDIINGQPLKYRRTEDDRFVLYSVGWNEKDDGGVVVPSKTNRERADQLQGDWVWEYPERK